jgi:hypothetical protein
MDIQKFFFPVGVAAAIVGIWVALRKPNVGPTTSNQVNPSPSGLPNYTPQAVQYQVNPPQLAAPSQIQLLSDPLNPNPALPPNPQYATPPAYLAFNFGPGHDLSKIPLTDAQIAQLNGNRPTQSDSGCGCSGSGFDLESCQNNPNKAMYPDGRGGLMSQTGKTLIQQLNRQDPAWPQRAAYNLAGSDIDPSTLPFRSNSIIQQAPLQPGQATPAAPNQSLSTSSPGSNVVNQPISQFPVGLNIVPVATPQNGVALFKFGAQVPKLGFQTISRLTGVHFVS